MFTSNSSGSSKVEFYLMTTILGIVSGIRCIYKAALALVAFLRKPTKATIYCHAQARPQGLQADPRRLANAHAAH